MIKAGFPAVGVPFVNPETGVIDQAWYLLLQTLWQRTGSAPGVDVATVVQAVTTITNEVTLAIMADAPFTPQSEQFASDLIATPNPVPPVVALALTSLQQAVQDLATIIAVQIIDAPKPTNAEAFFSELLDTSYSSFIGTVPTSGEFSSADFNSDFSITGNR